jgi:hypothetical protein
MNSLTAPLVATDINYYNHRCQVTLTDFHSQLPNWQTSYKISIVILGDIEYRMKRLLDYLRGAVAEMASK